MENRILEQIKTYAQELNEEEFMREIERKKSLGFIPGKHFLCYRVSMTQAPKFNQYVILNFRKSGAVYIAYHKSSTSIAAINEIRLLLGAQSRFIKTIADSNTPNYCKMTIENEHLIDDAELVKL
jgi:hypothetical protein